MAPRPVPDLAEAADRVGDRWTLLLVGALLEGPRRFGELESALGGIAPNVLAKRLRQLESDGVVRATPYSSRPVRLEYELTDAGRELAGALALLAAWGRRQAGVADASLDPGAGVEHRRCGTALVTRLWCPTCDCVVDDPAHDDLEHL